MLKDYLSKLFAVAMLVSACVFANAQNVTITEPASIAGDYPYALTAFGPFTSGVSGQIVYVDDGDATTGTVNDGCQAFVTDVAGKIALVDRGLCNFSVKALNAQAGGAIAILVCNNAVFPDSIFIAGGNDGCALGIPAMMVSNNNCAIIKAELANGATVLASIADNFPALGEAVGAAIDLPGAGIYTADPLTGTGAVFTDAISAKVYTITAPMDAVMNVHSCLGGADTRVTVLEGCRNVLAILGQGDDDCPFETGDMFDLASNLDVIVYAGQQYIIHWDDRWSADGFAFEVSFSDLPIVAATLSVDMQDVALDPAGAFIAGSFNGGIPEPMTDNGDGTFSYTTMTTAGFGVGYLFLNGPTGIESGLGLETCGVDDGTGTGGFIRVAFPGLEGVDQPLVCFESCGACPPDVACPNWVQDDFESYTLGGISAQSDIWNPWTAGSTTEDAVVVNTTVNSGAQSMQISVAGADDQLLVFGDRTSGHFILKWKMFVPTGSGAYYNLQKAGATPGVGDAFANEVRFNADGTGDYLVGTATSNGTFTYPHDVWFDVYHDIDLDNNINRFWIDGAAAIEHPANWQSNAETGIAQIGGVDFFGLAASSSNYFVDDVLFKEVEPCPADAIICDGLDAYDLGAPGPQSPWWDTWTFMPGGADDGLVVNEAQLSCEQSLKISEVGADDVLLLLGDRGANGGEYDLSWNMLVPAGSAAYYNTQKVEATPGNEYGIEVFFNAGGTGTINAGTVGAFTFSYPHDTWFSVSHSFNFDTKVLVLNIDGTDVMTFTTDGVANATAVGLNQLGSVDFFGTTGNLYYVDDILFTGVDPVIVPGINVTFQVDMTWVLDGGGTVEGVKIAGNFGDNGTTVPNWDPPSSPAFTAIGNDIYQVTIEFPATSIGSTLEYKFLNTANTWGACGVEQECMGPEDAACKNPANDNRILVIPATDIAFCYTWETCVACDSPNSTRERLINIPMTIAPNPFSSQTLVTFNTPILDAEARLTTLTGQLVREYQVNGSQLTIEKDGLQPGVYFFNVVTENGVSAAQKLIVQ